MLRKGKEISAGGARDPSTFKPLLIAQMSFYFTMIKLCGLTMLSDLYNHLLHLKEQNVVITTDQLDFVNSFFDINEESKHNFDFTTLIKSIREVLEKTGVKPFISEYDMFRLSYSPTGDIFEAHVELCSINYLLTQDRIDDFKLQSYCEKVEGLLWKVIEKVYFVMRYKLAAIKRIELIKFRSEEPSYQHNRIILHRSIEDKDDEDEAYLPEDIVEVSASTDSRSVLLFKGLSDFSTYLNISPFVIDMNTLKDENTPLLYMFSHFGPNNSVVFEEVQNPSMTITLAVDTREKDEAMQIPYVRDLINKNNSDKRKLTRKLKAVLQQFSKLKECLKEVTPS